MGFANHGVRRTTQNTFYVGGKKVTIRITNRTWFGNHSGYNVLINGEKFYVNCLSREEASDKAYARWVKTQD